MINFQDEEKRLALETLKQVNRAIARGETEYDQHPIDSAHLNAIDGMIEAGWTQQEINHLYHAK